MQGCSLQAHLLSGGRVCPLSFPDSSAFLDLRSRRASISAGKGCLSRLKSLRAVKVQASNANTGARSYDEYGETDSNRDIINKSASEASTKPRKSLSGVSYLLSIAGVLVGCTLVFALVAFSKGGPSTLIAALAKSGFTAAFTLIFVSEIGDKTFFIAALLAMQYDKALVLFGSMGALSLMTILSVIIGRIFQSVPAQFQTTLPIGEYAAVALLIFFGFKSIKTAWEIPSEVRNNSNKSPELGELIEAEELVKEKVAKKLTNPLEIIWKSFSLVFFAYKYFAISWNGVIAQCWLQLLLVQHSPPGEWLVEPLLGTWLQQPLQL